MINNNLNNYNQKHKSYNINHKQFLTSFGRYTVRYEFTKLACHRWPLWSSLLSWLDRQTIGSSLLGMSLISLYLACICHTYLYCTLSVTQASPWTRRCLAASKLIIFALKQSLPFKRTAHVRLGERGGGEWREICWRHQRSDQPV